MLYVATWIGGGRSHAYELRARAQRDWAEAVSENERARNLTETQGNHRFSPRPLLPRGPSAGVDWCAPILPGVLVAGSWHRAGPLWTEGGVKLVLYYGVGSMEFCTVIGWIA